LAEALQGCPHELGKGGPPVKFAHSRNPEQTSLLSDGPEPTILLGETANAVDAARLTGQRAQVEAIMSDGFWHTLPGLSSELRRRFGSRSAETSISARLRDLRRKGYRLDRERTRPNSGLYQYRAIKVETEAAA